MEVDDVQRLLERTRARKEMMAKKRRPAHLSDECQFQSQEPDFTANIDESPKRQCLNNVGEVSSTSEDSDLVDFDNDKENDFEMSDDTSFPYVPSHVKGLAALQRHTASTEDVKTTSVPKNHDAKVKVNTTPYYSSTKSRLASLAANIKQWDDDDDDDHHSHHHHQRQLFQTNTPRPINKLTSNKFCSDTANLGAPPAKRVSFHPSCDDTNRVSASNARDPYIFRSEIVQDKQKQPQKVRVWDQAILTTLESQGFVKSPSKAKLQYNFAKKQSSSDSSSDDEADCDEGIEDESGDTKEEESVPAVLKSTLPTPPDKEAKNVTPVPYNGIPKTTVPSVNISTDPAELPLLARKALFERAFCGSQSKPAENVIEQNLSVAQRAALFEKGAKTVSVPKMKPQKIDSPVKQICSPVKTRPLQSPEKVVMSPSKNASSHTRTVQQQLIDNSANDWKKKDIVAKACDERKNEISALLNHWERVSASSTENGSTDITHESIKKSSSSGSEKYEAVFEEAEEQYDEMENDDVISEIDDNKLQEDVESEMNDSDGDELQVMPEDDALSFASESTQPDSIANDEEDLNGALDAGFEQVETPQMPPPPAPLPILNQTIVSQNGTKNSYSRDVESTSSQRGASVELSSSAYSDVSQSECESPLLHTVSFYRKQKKQRRVTPVKAIVRRAEVVSPPSPKKMSTEMVENKLKALQEEILAQQTVISQTSQALNLCHATEEFSGSTEQVECERLLLIATQKRLGCLNEIQRLKNPNVQLSEEGMGTLILNDLKLPLKRDFITSQLTGGSEDIHHFLCLVRYGHQVIVTQMLSAQESVQSGSLTFTNHITLHNLPPDFSVAFEVYTLQTKKEVLPHDKKYHIKRDHGKIRITPKSKKSDSKLSSPAISSPGGPNAVRTPSFAVVGYTRFTLQNSNKRTFTLEKVPFSSPLDGVLLLKMQLHAEHSVVEKGFLTLFEDISGFGAWHRRWCVLNGNSLAFWKYPDDETDPLLVLDLKQCITREFRLVPRDICARPHTFELLTVRRQEKGDRNTLISRSVNTLTTTKYLLSADTKEERIMWCKRLNNAVDNVRKWDPNMILPTDSKQGK